MAFRSVLRDNCFGRRRKTRLVADGRTLLKIWDDGKYQDAMQSSITSNRKYIYGGQRAGYPVPQPRDSPKIMEYARLAVQQYNKQKNSQLQLVRAVRAISQESRRSGHYYYLTMEALDAQVVKVYQAVVYHEQDDPWLYLFGLVGNGGLLKLIDNSHLDLEFGGVDCRYDPPIKIKCSLNEQTRDSRKTKEKYFPKDEILGSSHKLPFQQS